MISRKKLIFKYYVFLFLFFYLDFLHLRIKKSLMRYPTKNTYYKNKLYKLAFSLTRSHLGFHFFGHPVVDIISHCKCPLVRSLMETKFIESEIRGL